MCFGTKSERVIGGEQYYAPKPTNTTTVLSNKESGKRFSFVPPHKRFQSDILRTGQVHTVNGRVVSNSQIGTGSYGLGM